MVKLRSKRFYFIRFGFGGSGNRRLEDRRRFRNHHVSNDGVMNSEIKWEMRPGGMLVQKRDQNHGGEVLITIRVSSFDHLHDISIEATSTFGELKMVLSMVTGLEPREQRLLFKGKEREDYEFLHMVGIKDKDKVFLLEDPAVRELKKLHGAKRHGHQFATTLYHH